MTTDDASKRVASRINSTSGYYPIVEELLDAMNNDVDYKALTGKLTKDWLHCLLKDTPLRLKEAKSYSKTLNLVDSRMNTLNGILDEQKMVTEEIKQKLSEFNIKSMETYKTNERQIVKPAISDNKFLRQLKVIGIPENNQKVF